jgi:glycogen phosphorylase
MSDFVVLKQEHLKGDANSLKNSIISHLHYTLAKDRYTATKRDLFMSVAYAIRDQLVGRWIRTQQQYYDADAKRIYYLSMEFLIGRTLENSLVNLGLLENCQKALHDLGYELNQLVEVETDAGLGNGGLGRLAACFLDSMATLGIPGYGYGIRYDYGIFTQKIKDGQQIETPDNWLRYGNPWEICRTEYLYPIPFYGRVVQYVDSNGRLKCDWIETQEVMAMAYDTPICGYNNDTVNTLRLWQAKSPRGFDFSYFNHGDYIRAVEDIALKENISKVLYPNDNIFEGKELRLKQEYFLVSATIQDIIRRYNKGHVHLDALPDKVAIQLNDTHPALAISEMMRILVDREELSWDKAWELTKDTFGYTNHTLLPEALERWSVPLMENILPRHLQIIYEINKRWLDEVDRHYPGDIRKQKDLSIIEESSPKTVNMAHLAIVGSRKVNGVSSLHTELLKQRVFRDFWEMDPGKFTNKTNGITPRRWLKSCNPRLSQLITDHIGNEWITDLNQLEKLIQFESDNHFCQQWQMTKKANKTYLAKLIFAEHELTVNADTLFDCHVKRIHEYKRQFLNILRVVHDYIHLKERSQKEYSPRTVIFSGKAAPGYFLAKKIISLIHAIANVINHDKAMNDHLKVIFLENYRVALAEKIIPAADLSEQISTAGTEASGTGNMKFALNGALTIGTLDGANIEIQEQVGAENIFIFGLKAEEVLKLKEQGYNPWDYYHKNDTLRQVLDMIKNGFFSSGNQEFFRPLWHSLLDGGDPYFLLADFDSYIETQKKVDNLYQNQNQWIKKSIHNVAKMGKFSSDRTIQEYASEIWRLDYS